MKYSVSNRSLSKYYGLLFLFYFMAHGGILLIPNAIFWDDWTIFEVNPDLIFDTFHQAGSMFNFAGYMHVAFLSIGPWFYKISTFLLMFGAGVALNFILKKYESIGIEARFLIVLFFLVLPFYWARVALIDMGYTVCYFIFFLAWALIEKYRRISLALFFISFNTNSLLFFYALPFADLYYRNNGFDLNARVIVTFCIKNFSYLCLPFVFFLIKIYFFSPYGLYDGYNEHFSHTNLSQSLNLMLLDLNIYIKSFFNQFSAHISIFLFLLLFYKVLRKKNYNYKFLTANQYIYFAVGSVAVLFGAFPYWILGHVPTFSEWTSRHQLLLPLGTSIILASIIGLLHLKMRAFAVSVLLAVFLSMNLFTYIDFFVDWQKQKQIISLFQSSNIVKDSDLIVINDGVKNLNAVSRTYRPYEWNGLLYQAFRDEKRFGIHDGGLSSFMGGGATRTYFSHGEYFRCGEFSIDLPIRVVELEIFLVNNGQSIDKLQFNYSIGLSVRNVKVVDLAALY